MLGLDVEHALLALGLEVRLELRPDRFRTIRRCGEKCVIPFVRRNVAYDEIADVDRLLPAPRIEGAPGTGSTLLDRGGGLILHDVSPSELFAGYLRAKACLRIDQGQCLR